MATLSSSSRVWLFVALPFAVFASMLAVFQGAAAVLGAAGYLVGFIVYWVGWCMAVPYFLLGKDEFKTLLRDRRPLFSRENWSAAVLLLIITVVTIVMYWGRLAVAPWPLIAISIPLAIINGTCEELLWRGTYVRAFPDQPWLGLIVPSLGFALWHLAPQSLRPAVDKFAFVSSTLFLGLAYGWIAWRTGSARWSALSHVLNGILAVGGAVAPAMLLLFGG